MRYCPKCGKEYPADVADCSKCGVDLVDNQPDDIDANFDVDVKTVLLCKTSDIMSVEILEQALKDHNIPFLLKAGTGTYSGIGSISQVMKGVKVYVSETAFEKAVELAETIIPDFELPDESK
jgi:hypothetical protein